MTEPPASIDSVIYLVKLKMAILLYAPLLDTIHLTVGLNKHNVCSSRVSLQVTHVCSHLTTMGPG